MGPTPQATCAECGAAMDTDAQCCPNCGASVQPARRVSIVRGIGALLMLLPALGLGLLGGTCSVIGLQSSGDSVSLLFGLAMLAGAGLVAYGAVAFVRRKA